VNVRANIVVTDGGAVPAKNIGVIRDLLGIKASDNLTHANFALVVEGEEDAIALKSLLPVLSEKTGRALKNNSLIIEPIGGAGNLSYKLSLLKNSLCATYTLLDGDEAGRAAYAKADGDGLISSASCTFIICAGMQESEFEDCIDVEIYKAAMLSELGVDLNDSKFRGNAKWSIRLKSTFNNQGKLFDNKVCSRAKYVVAKEVARSPKVALNAYKRNSLDALVVSLERLVKM
jgi:predicted ATP-dependent endonuclease of OLD family